MMKSACPSPVLPSLQQSAKQKPIRSPPCFVVRLQFNVKPAQGAPFNRQFQELRLAQRTGRSQAIMSQCVKVPAHKEVSW